MQGLMLTTDTYDKSVNVIVISFPGCDSARRMGVLQSCSVVA